MSEDDEKWMRYALTLAGKAEQQGEIPVGAVLVQDDQILGEGWNMSITAHDPSSHAEMVAIRQAGKQVENYRLINTTLYVTLEPCPMCAGLLVHSRIDRLVFGASDLKTGAAGSVMNIVCHDELNHQIEVCAGVLEEECASKISNFFKMRRMQKKQERNKQKLGEG